VAEEVRKLAEQTAQAAREVGGLIESIQMESQESISAMADEHAQVEAEVRRVNEAGVALERISETSSDSAQRVGEISRATLHQLRVTQEVVSAMQRISEIAKSIGKQTEGVCGTTQTLTKLVHQLDDSLGPLRRCSEGADDERAGATTGSSSRRQPQGSKAVDQEVPALAPRADAPVEALDRLLCVAAETEPEQG
jgi:hypothetical protein